MQIKRANAALVAAFKDIPTSIISDVLDRMPCIQGMIPFHKSGKMAGSAFTVQTRSGDNKMIHAALEHLTTGDVLMIDAGGDLTRAVFGEIMGNIALSKGGVGIVVDGVIRDRDFFMQNEFGCYAKGFNPRGPFKAGPGAINIPVTVGDWIVNPGDIVVGDLDGVVTFGEDIAEGLLVKCQEKLAWEVEQIAAIKNGTYKGTYN